LPLTGRTRLTPLAAAQITVDQAITAARSSMVSWRKTTDPILQSNISIWCATTSWSELL
jgi:hypothetical protein